jgi:hypothetical protein
VVVDVTSVKTGLIKISLIKNKVMATKRKTKKKENPCGEGYRREEIVDESTKTFPDVESGESGEKGYPKNNSKKRPKKKYRCVKIRKPGIKKEELRGDKMKTTPKTDPLDKEKG